MRRLSPDAHAFELRAYVVRMAEMSSGRRAAQLEVAAPRAIAGARTTAALAEAGHVALAAQEWRRINRACTRELNRLAAIKHGRPRA